MKKTNTKRNLLRIGGVFALMALWVLLPFMLNGKIVSADELSDTRIQASLSGAPINGTTPAGFSEYRIDDNNRRRLDVQATSVNLAAGTVLQIPSYRSASISNPRSRACAGHDSPTPP